MLQHTVAGGEVGWRGTHHGGDAVSRGGELGHLRDVVLGDGGVAGDLAESVGLLGRCWLVTPDIASLVTGDMGLAQSSSICLHHLTSQLKWSNWSESSLNLPLTDCSQHSD